MTKKRIIILTIFSTILILSNIYSGYINVFTEGLFKSYLFQTEKAEFEFWTMPSKGRNIEMMELQFEDFKEQNPEYSDLELHRTFSRNPLKFWNWFDYLANDRYQYKYQNKISQAFEQPLDINEIETAFIKAGPNFQESDLNDPKRSIPFEYIEQITNEMNTNNEYECNMNIRYDLPDEIWNRIPNIYKQMDGWLGFGKDGKGEKGIPYWFSYIEEEKSISASVEPSGLHFCANMEYSEWIQWKTKFKNLATKTLGFKVGEIEEGEVGYEIEWMQ